MASCCFRIDVNRSVSDLELTNLPSTRENKLIDPRLTFDS